MRLFRFVPSYLPCGLGSISFAQTSSSAKPALASVSTTSTRASIPAWISTSTPAATGSRTPRFLADQSQWGSFVELDERNLGHRARHSGEGRRWRRKPRRGRSENRRPLRLLHGREGRGRKRHRPAQARTRPHRGRAGQGALHRRDRAPAADRGRRCLVSTPSPTCTTPTKSSPTSIKAACRCPIAITTSKTMIRR